MMARNHVICSAAALALIAGSAAVSYDVVPVVGDTINNYVSVPSIFLCIPLYFLGTLIPDLDSPSSVLGRYSPIKLPHRTILHSLWIPILLSVFFHDNVYVMWFVAGYLVHVLLDSISVMGVCFFWPYPGYRSYGSGAKIKKHHVVKLYHANTREETVVAISFIVLCLGILLAAVLFGKSAYLLNLFV